MTQMKSTRTLSIPTFFRLLCLVGATLALVLAPSAWRPALAQSLESKKASYAPSEPIQIEYAGFPGNAKDWITLVPQDAPPDTYGEWFYTDGKKAGSYQFKGLAPGSYQLRAYLDWPTGGYNIRAKLAITVGSVAPASAGGASKATLAPNRAKYAPGEAIQIEYKGFTGAQDWITVVPQSAPPEQYAEWFYTKGVQSGRLTFRGLTPGKYEARAYFNWPSGGYAVQARAAFEVTGGAQPGVVNVKTSQAVFLAEQAI